MSGMNGLVEPLPLIALPKTGQTTSYRSGDDGDLEAGHPRTTRFVDTGRGVILDHVTGLMWVKQPELIIPGATGIHSSNQVQRARSTWKVPPDDGLGDYVAGDLVQGDGAPDALFYVCILGHTAHAGKEPPNATYWRETVWTASAADLTTPTTMTWNDAIDNCLGSDLGGGGLSYGGHDDWRLPNALEHGTLWDFSRAANPLTYTSFFPNTQASNYWTSTSYGPFTTWAVYWRGDACYGSMADKTDANKYVRAVRGGVVND